jgi:hypothetical protein
MTNSARTLHGRGARIEHPLLIPALLAALGILTPYPSAAQAPTYEIIHSFQGSPDGADPKGALVIGANGVLYGTTFAGGASVLGTVFEMTKPTGEPWKETVLHSFSGSDGQYPQSALTFGSTGTLYGVTIGGGGGAGAIFELAPPSTTGGAWTETVLYTYPFGRDSQNQAPNGPPLIGPGGTMYVTTQGAPAGGVGAYLGTIDAVVPPATTGAAWTEDVLLTFGTGGVTGATTGAQPVAGVVSEGGSLFGTTRYSGDPDCYCGTVYALTPSATHGGAWTETTIHTFTYNDGDGESPEAALTVGPGGVLYGTTSAGGTVQCYTIGTTTTNGCGTVFQLTPPSAPGGAWTESVIYNFTGADGDGAVPIAGVVVGQNGTMYGTTSSAGSTASQSACPASYFVVGGCGIVFELTPPSTPGGAWTETVLHAFSGQEGDGAIPVAGLALSSTGVLYGTTSAGGAAGKGTVFAIAP